MSKLSLSIIILCSKLKIKMCRCNILRFTFYKRVSQALFVSNDIFLGKSSMERLSKVMISSILISVHFLQYVFNVNLNINCDIMFMVLILTKYADLLS